MLILLALVAIKLSNVQVDVEFTVVKYTGRTDILSNPDHIMPEVYFSGTIHGASGFDEPALFALWSVLGNDDSWTLIEGDAAGQTHVIEVRTGHAGVPLGHVYHSSRCAMYRYSHTRAHAAHAWPMCRPPRTPAMKRCGHIHLMSGIVRLLSQLGHSLPYRSGHSEQARRTR